MGSGLSKPSEIGSYAIGRVATVNFRNRKMSAAQNIVGTKLRAIRREKGLTQAMLAARCGMLGWDIGENTITKIETNVRCVVDAEIVCLATALDVLPEKLLPTPEKMRTAAKAYFASRPSKLDY